MTDANLTIGTGPCLLGSKWTRLRVRSCQVVGLPVGFGASCWVAEARIAGAPPIPTLVDDGQAGQDRGHDADHNARLVAQPRAEVQPAVEHHYYYHTPVEASSDWDMWGYWNAVFLGSVFSGLLGFSVGYLAGVLPAALSPTPIPSPSPPPSDDGSGDGPVFESVGDIVFPANTESGLLLAMVVAQDDAGLADAPYSLVGTSPFTIEESTGRILMPANIQQGTYSLVVQAANSQGQTSRQTIQITIEAPDNAEPVLSTDADVAAEITSLRYLETEGTFLSSSKAVGAVVGAITVQDAYAVRYSIDDNRFDIDDEGVITIAGSSDSQSASAAVVEPATLPLGANGTRLSEASPARQTQLESDELEDDTYDFTVTVTDISGNSASLDVTITIDTTPPSFGDDASNGFLVSSGAGDTVVGAAAATDVSALSYSLENDADGSFVIDGSSGEIRIASGTTLTDGLYEVTVAATDAAGNSASLDVTITVDTEEPDISGTETTAFVNGLTTTASVLLRVDSRGETGLSYSLLDTDEVSGASSYFAIDADGVVRLLGEAPDDGPYGVTVAATDAAGNSASHEIVLTVDRTAPDLSGTVTMATVNGATDHESDLLTINSNGEAGLSYRLEVANNQASTFFTIGDDGIVRLIENASPSEGDHSVTVIATDAAGNSTSHEIMIIVNTVISILTEFLNGTEFVEGAVGDGVKRFAVADAFHGTDYTYRLVDGNSLPAGLSLNEVSGVLTGTLALTSILDAEVFTFDIEAVLNGNVERTARFEFDVGVNLGPADLAAETSFSITGSDGADHVETGTHFSARKTSTLTLFDGDNVVDIADYHPRSQNSSKITITAGSGNDIVTLGSNLARGSGSVVDINLGDGDNSFIAGSNIAYNYGRLTFESGDGKDTVLLGNSIGYQNNASAEVITGGGADKIIVGNNIGGNSGNFFLDSGEGNDVVQIDAQSTYRPGPISLSLGQGDDHLVFSGNLVNANTTIDLADGPEPDADTVIFRGSLSGVTVKNVGEGDILAFPVGQIFDEFTDSDMATINGLTNDGAADGQAQVGLSFDGTVSATLTEEEITYDLFDGGEWGTQTDNFTVVTFGA